jgi:hypothetical protein
VRQAWPGFHRRVAFEQFFVPHPPIINGYLRHLTVPSEELPVVDGAAGQTRVILLYSPSMTDKTRQMALTRWLRDELIHGIVLTDDVVNYLEATFGTRDFASVVADADACEIDSLMELLFFPDAAIQERYETRWGQEIVSEQDRDNIIASLCQAPVVAQITLPSSDGTLNVCVPAFACRAFVERMNICRHPPAQLSKLLGQPSLREVRIKVRVQLRNAGIVWHKSQVSLISLYLTRMPAATETFGTDLDFLISILSEMAEDVDAYGFLIDKKLFYFNSLCSAEDYERKRLASNMEIMMLSGARSGHGSMDQWRHWMRCVDRICQNLFGRTRFFTKPVAEASMRRRDDLI